MSIRFKTKVFPNHIIKLLIQRMSDHIELSKVTKADYFSHLTSLCFRLWKVYNVSTSGKELLSFKTKKKEIRESKKKEDEDEDEDKEKEKEKDKYEDELGDLERSLIKLFKSIDFAYFESSKWTTKVLSDFEDGEVIRSFTFKILERKVIQMENEEWKFNSNKKSQLNEDKSENKNKSKENTMKQDEKSNEDKKEDNQVDYDSKILKFLNENKSDQQMNKFKHLINWSKIYLYL